MAKKVSKAEKQDGVAQEETLKEKYERLINEIKPHLLTNAQLKSGGRVIRTQHQKEAGYANVINEINQIGQQLGYPKIGLGHLRG